MNDNSIKIENLYFANSLLKFEINGNKPTLNISGKLDHDDFFSTLWPYLFKLHNYILEKNYKNIFVFVTNVTYINDDALHLILKWLTQLLKLVPEERYYIDFYYSKEKIWQKQCLLTISNLMPEFIKLIGI